MGDILYITITGFYDAFFSDTNPDSWKQNPVFLEKGTLFAEDHVFEWSKITNPPIKK